MEYNFVSSPGTVSYFIIGTNYKVQCDFCMHHDAIWYTVSLIKCYCEICTLLFVIDVLTDDDVVVQVYTAIVFINRVISKQAWFDARWTEGAPCVDLFGIFIMWSPPGGALSTSNFTLFRCNETCLEWPPLMSGQSRLERQMASWDRFSLHRFQ